MIVMQVLSFIGAAAILIAYISQLRGWIPNGGEAYCLYNIVGSILLAGVAIHAAQPVWAFLNIFWALESTRAYVARWAR